MMNMKWGGFLGLRWGSAVVLSLSTGCGPVLDDGSQDDADSGGTSTGMTSNTTLGTTSGSASGSASITASTTDGSSTTGVMTTIGTTDSTVSSASATVTTDPTDPTDPPDPTDPTDPTGDGLPDGSMCDDGNACASGHCYVVGPLGGVCGQCEVDQDCGAGGCTLPNPLAQPPTGSVCNAGTYGAGCMSDEVCEAPLMCALVLDIPGILQTSTCSECRDAGDCSMGWTCEPDLAVAALTGVKRCVAPATLANGQTCDLAGGGVACGSGHCAGADVLGVLEVGVCSGCGSDGDCADGLVCEPPQVDLNAGVVPGGCAP